MGCRELQYYFSDRANSDYHRGSAAHFEYSPFGKTTVASGTIPNRFAFRFSSEYHDSETGLVYYNYRYYSPELGRWLSRDPYSENGGLNLYAFVDNDPVGRWDLRGLESRYDRTKDQIARDMKQLIREEESGKTAQEIANKYDPTLGAGSDMEKLVAYNLTVESSIGPVDVDWLLLLLNKSDDDCWCFNADDTYKYGKLFWTFFDAIFKENRWFGFSVKHDNGKEKRGVLGCISDHMKEYYGEEEKNALKIVNEILLNNKKLGDFFPKYQKEVIEEMKNKNKKFISPPAKANPRLRLNSETRLI